MAQDPQDQTPSATAMRSSVTSEVSRLEALPLIRFAHTGSENLCHPAVLTKKVVRVPRSPHIAAMKSGSDCNFSTKTHSNRIFR